MDRLFVIDGHALIFRMYYAFLRRPMINSKGVDTSILYGFTKYILEIISKENPTHMAVAFDPPCATFRHEAYPEYKANRSAAPELVKEALDPLCEIVQALGIPVVMKPGFEADDVICSIAKRFAGEGMQVYMVTPDKDFGQCVTGNIFQYKPGKGGGENIVMDEKAICEYYGIPSSRNVIDILSIWGDSSDNVPGVAGVGEVGAKKLVGKYGGLDNIYAHLDELTPKMRESFIASKDHIEMSRFLVTIKDDIDPGITPEEMKLTVSCSQKVAELFDRYEFGSLLKMLPQCEGGAQPAAMPAAKYLEYQPVSKKELLGAVKDTVAVDLAEESTTAVLAADGRCARFTLDDSDFADVMQDPAVAKTGHGLKNMMHILGSAGIEMNGRLLDIEIMHYLLESERSHKLDFLLRSYLDLHMEAAPAEQAGKPAEEPAAQFDLFSIPEPQKAEKTESDDDLRRAAACSLLAPVLDRELEKAGLSDLYYTLEMPLIRVLFDMEEAGVKIDVNQLNSFGASLENDAARLEEQIRGIAEDPSMNVQSPRQIGLLLFEKLNLDPKVKKNKNGSYPTDEETLQGIADKHPVVDMILEYRGLKKLLSTYIAPFPGYINPRDGRVHTTFTQALTATGRLSSVKPNLQNITVRSSLGQEIRKAFVPGADCIVAADYSQLELRIMAHLSGDGTLVEEFRKGDDIHAATAAKIYGVPVKEVTKDQRRYAKTANFGIMYGISSFGLAQRIGISRSDAKKLIDDYFTSFPGVRRYIDKTVEEAREKGYVETLFGRRRYLPDINSRNHTVRSLAERNAVNAPIQGGSADIIKMAMIAINRRMKEEGFRSRMVLQIHDELLFDTYNDEKEALMELVKKEMQEICQLSVPLIVDCNAGENWLEAH